AVFQTSAAFSPAKSVVFAGCARRHSLLPLRRRATAAPTALTPAPRSNKGAGSGTEGLWVWDCGGSGHPAGMALQVTPACATDAPIDTNTAAAAQANPIFRM